MCQRSIWRDALLAIVMGIGLALLAAAAPALEASRVTPLAALRGADRLEARYRVNRRQLALGASLLLAAGACSQLGPLGGLPVFGFAAAVATVFGIAFLVPATLALLSRFGARPLTACSASKGSSPTPISPAPSRASPCRSRRSRSACR